MRRAGLIVALALFLAANPAAAQGDAPARGPAGAALEIVMFSDFQCPYCAGAIPVLDSLVARNPADVRVVYRHYPLPNHEHAEQAAIAAIEAARQGAFWPYHDLLFTHQDRLADVDLVGYADSLGLDAEAFARALSERTHADAVQTDVALAESLSVTGTPTFFVNGYRLVGVPPLWVWEEAVRAFREGRATARTLTPTSPDESSDE